MKGLYIHIPFCCKKCNYCDFASFPNLFSRADEYIDALLKEMEIYKDENINTIYFGGGTPSVLTACQLHKIMDGVFSSFNVSTDSEITIEVNPCTVDYRKAKDILDIGFNRVSLGAQSFVDTELNSLGRLGSSDDTLKAYNDLSSAGFNNISLDLMYAIPGQTIDTLSTSLGCMLKLKPKHISCYGLKIEDGTPFADMKREGIITEKSDDEYADMYEFICSTLSNAGYIQYELSNFSLPGYHSRHNLKYWTLCDYIGIGLSSSSCYRGERYTRTHNFEKYIKSFENAESYKLTKDEAMSEYMFLSFRLTQRGANKQEFKDLFNLDIEDVFFDEINKHIKNGLILDRGDSYILTPKAYYISNAVLCDFV